MKGYSVNKLLGLLLVLCITPSHIIVGAEPIDTRSASTAAAPGTSESKENREDTELEALKLDLIKNGLYFTGWATASDDLITKATNCGHTASYLWSYYTGQQPPLHDVILQCLHKKNLIPHLPALEFVGPLKDFFNRKISISNIPMMNMLLGQPFFRENLIFYVIKYIPTDDDEINFHTFVIRKRNNGSHSHYTILQSHYFHFPLCYWLEMEKSASYLPALDKKYIEQHEYVRQHYAPNKELTAQDVENYMSGTYGNDGDKPNLFYIKIATVLAPRSIAPSPDIVSAKTESKACDASPATPMTAAATAGV